MNNYFKLTDEQRRTVIIQIGHKTDLPIQAIEKDLWITTILQLIFTLPFAENIVFKGGTSLSKIWNVIERFSEDIDLAIDRKLFDYEGDLTKKEIKKLRKASSLFVKDEFCEQLQKVIISHELQEFCLVETEPDGEGDNTYPEPRKIYVYYHSLFDAFEYISPKIVLEVSSRSLIEPTSSNKVKSLISENTSIETSLVDPEITTVVPEKTFLEKAFLLHELFISNRNMSANRKSRHLYDLEKMMDSDFALQAISNNDLWNAIQHHRSIFTSVSGIDYESDIRSNICLVPPANIIEEWEKDYELMQSAMIYGDSLSFDKLIERIKILESRFHNYKSQN